MIIGKLIRINAKKRLKVVIEVVLYSSSNLDSSWICVGWG